jgi:hypothetical protein
MKRAAKLYIGKKDIGCRECWKLHYKSQSADRLDRMHEDTPAAIRDMGQQ